MDSIAMRRLPAAPGASRIRTGARRGAALVGLVAAFVAAGCSRNPGVGPVEPGVEPRLVAATRPDTPRLVLFSWSLREGASRFSGQGAARVAPEYRARLDLFGPQDVLYLSALLRDGELVLPAGVPSRIVPPAPLLWSAFGVVRPPDGARVVTATERGDEATLAYDGDDGRWRFRFRGGALVHAEWVSDRGARHTVELSGAAGGAQRAVYRDWQEYRELILEIEEQEYVEEFPPDTWILDAR